MSESTDGVLLEGVYCYKDLFKEFPNKWLIIKALIRDNRNIRTMSVVKDSISKREIFEEAKKRRKAGEDVAIVSTIEALEDASEFVYFKDGIAKKEYVSPAEYALMFRMCYGLPILKSELA